MSDELNCVDAAVLHDFAETIDMKQTRAWERVRRAVHAEAVRITDEWGGRDHWVRREVDTSARVGDGVPWTPEWWPQSTVATDALAWHALSGEKSQAVARELHRRALEYARAMQASVPVIYAAAESLLGVQIISDGEREMYGHDGGSDEVLANRCVNTLVGLDRPGGWESAEVARVVRALSVSLPSGVQSAVEAAHKRTLDPNRLASVALHQSAEALLAEIETVAGEFAWSVTGIDDLRSIRAQSFGQYMQLPRDMREALVVRVEAVRAEFEAMRHMFGGDDAVQQ